jgi:hypothetical protein
MARPEHTSSRLRVGPVSLYLHHGALWLSYRAGGRPVRRKVCDALSDAGQIGPQHRWHMTLEVSAALDDGGKNRAGADPAGK